MESIRDRDTLGALAGIGGILARNAWNFFAKQAGLAKFYVWNLSADIFMKNSEIKTVLGTILGFASDIVFAALIGVAYVNFLKKRNDGNPITKGLGFGLGAWLLFFGLLLHSITSVTNAPDDAKSTLSGFIGHLVFGLVMGVLWRWLVKYVEEPIRDL